MHVLLLSLSITMRKKKGRTLSEERGRDAKKKEKESRCNRSVTGGESDEKRKKKKNLGPPKENVHNLNNVFGKNNNKTHTSRVGYFGYLEFTLLERERE